MTLNNDNALIELIREHNGSVTTWWYNDFYDAFCRLYELNSNNIKQNTVKMRNELNKLVKLGLLEKSSSGSQHGGKRLYGFNRCNSWTIKSDR